MRLLLPSLALFVLACAPRIERGAACTRSGECPTPTVCIDGRCLEECRVQADCPIGARCLEVQGQGRCLFEDENTCTSDGDCGDPDVVCRDAHCFNTCDRCADLGAVCELDVCVREVRLDAGGPRDGGGAPVFDGHRACIDGMSCDLGDQCVSDDGASPVCRTPCTTGADCSSRICVRPAGSTTTAFCALQCNALDEAGTCPAGEACALLERNEPGTGTPHYVWGCRAVGTPSLAIDEACNLSAPEYCPLGTACGGPGPSYTCLPVCNVARPACPSGRECLQRHSDDETFPVGYCQPRSPSSDAGVDATTIDAGP